jgi:hypothetical protein
MPEGEIIDGIDCQHAVVAPASAGMGLVAPTGGHYGFALTEIIQGIRSQPSGITNGRFLCRTGGGIGDGHVSVLIHCDAGHPPPQTIIAIRPALLLHRRSGEIAASNIHLIPANGSWPVRVIQNNSLGRP